MMHSKLIIIYTGIRKHLDSASTKIGFILSRQQLLVSGYALKLDKINPMLDAALSDKCIKDILK